MDKPIVYLSFEDLPVFNFYKIVETTDMRWFYSSFRRDKSLKISKEEEAGLGLRYKEIYEDRVKYTNDIKTAEYYRKLNEISDLETKLFRLTSSFNVIVELPLESVLFEEYVVYFNEDEGYKFTKEIKTIKDREDYLKWLKSKIKGFKTKTNVKKANYADILKPKEITTTTAKFDVIKEKIVLQESLGGISIDVYTCPLIEWCAMLMRAEEKSKDAKKQIEKLKNKR